MNFYLKPSFLVLGADCPPHPTTLASVVIPASRPHHGSPPPPPIRTTRPFTTTPLPPRPTWPLGCRTIRCWTAVATTAYSCPARRRSPFPRCCRHHRRSRSSPADSSPSLRSNIFLPLNQSIKSRNLDNHCKHVFVLLSLSRSLFGWSSSSVDPTIFLHAAFRIHRIRIFSADQGPFQKLGWI